MEVTALRFGRFRLDPVSRVLLADGLPVRIGARAVDLLLALAERQDRVVSKRELFDLVWPDLVVEENNLQQHIAALRKVLGPQAITTVPGRGYQLALKRDDAPATAAPAPAGPAAPARQTNVPGPLGQLVGRDADLADVRRRLADHAVVTLVGPGGVGKTRLAQAVARDALDIYADGVWAVDCAPLNDGAQVPAAVAHELGIVLTPPADTEAARVQPPAPREVQTVVSALGGQDLLLLLDNCEHVIAGAAVLVDALRQRAPRVRVLATSQVPLGLVDEQVVRMAPLALPPMNADSLTADEVAGHGAVQLFLIRAQAADRNFVPTPETLAPVVDICRRLDGLPLAIELAAARVPLLGVHDLRRRLDKGLRALASGRSRLPPRQQTLHSALAWSHALLSADEQAVFRRIAVFVGGFAVDLAEHMLGEVMPEPGAVLEALGALVDKSLVIADAGPAPRCRLLEPTRAFALEQLHAAGETAAMRQRHAQALCDRLQAFDREVAHEPRFDLLLHRMALELDNLRAAMQWVREAASGHASHAQAARRLGIGLAAFSDWLWLDVDPYGDGFEFCRTALAWLDESVPAALAARLRLSWHAHARSRQLAASQWSADARRAIDGFRACGDRIGLYRALCVLAGASRAVVGEDEAAALLDEAQRLEDPAWSPRLRMRRQVSLEWFHDLGGNLEASREAGLRHVALARAAGSVREVGALGNLADTEFALGHVDEAISLCRLAIERAAALSSPAAATNAYENMVPALLARGRLEEADEAIRAGRALLLRGLGSAYAMLLPLALLVHRRGDHRLAAQLVGCADRAYAGRGQAPDPPERRVRETLLAELPQALPGERLADLIEAGASWSEEQGFARAAVG